jgi:hypothetical protein
MRIYKPVGSTDRLLEVFQKVNKVKLNEDLGFGTPDAKTILTRGFMALKNGQLTINDGGSNTTTVQMTDDNSVVSINGVDKDKNQYTFVFKLEFNDGDQQGVYNVQGVQLQKFSYANANGSQTFELDENALQNFNSNYTNELFDIIDKYIDVKGQEGPNAEELQEAINIIDTMPFGKNSFDKMQTGHNYADNKPTNPSVRVKSPELDKFVKEEVAPVPPIGGVSPIGGKITDIKQLGRKLTKADVPNLHKDLLYKVAMGLANKMLPMSWDDLADVNSMWDYIREGMTFEQLLANVKKAVNKRLKEEGYSLKSLGLGETDKPAMKLKMQPVLEMDKPIAGMTLGGVVENEYDEENPGYGSEVDTMEYNPDDVENAEDMPQQEPETPTVDDVLPTDNEPVPEVSPEKRDKILQAYDALVQRNGTRNPNYSPTTPEVMAELDRMAGVKKPAKTRTYPKEAEPFLQEAEKKEVKKDEKKKEDKKKENTDAFSPFKQLGKTFKPKSQSKYPKKKKNPVSTVKINESTDRDKYEDVVFLQGDEAYQPLEILDTKGKDAAMEYLKQWHNPGQHQGSQELGNGTEDQTYEKDGYIMSWNSRLGYIGLQYDMANMNETEVYGDDDISNLPEVPKGYGEKGLAQKDMARSYSGIAQPVEEPAEFAEEAEPNAQKGIEDIDNPSPSEVGDEEEDMSKMPGIGTDDEGMPIPAIEPDFDKIGMSMEPETDNVEQLAQDKEEVGELIPGGKGEGKSPMEFSQEQILMGLKVEMEHTDDPMYALEIVLDHLTEDPEYYTSKETPEDSAQANASTDAQGGDKATTDVLLGFKPHNVGDEVEGDEEPEAEETPAESPVEAPVEEPEEKEEEPEEEKKEELNEGQIKIARETLTYRRVPTGMSKKEAVQILIKHNMK